MTPNNQIESIITKLLKISELEGYFKIDYYTGDMTILGVCLPEGLCTTRKFNQVHNDYEYEDFEWTSFSEYTQRMILLEVADLQK